MEGKKTILTILDGWGIGPVHSSDAIYNAQTPNFDRLWTIYPHSTLITFGEDVGLPEGQMGNSEVGHNALGAGRVFAQGAKLVSEAISSGRLFEGAAWKTAVSTPSPLHHQTIL